MVILNTTIYFVEEISEIMNVNPETVRRWIRKGDLNASSSSRRRGYYVTWDDLKDFSLTYSAKTKHAFERYFSRQED